jgi:hypothetical protein
LRLRVSPAAFEAKRQANENIDFNNKKIKNKNYKKNEYNKNCCYYKLQEKLTQT